jgi:hypothetical protein
MNSGPSSGMYREGAVLHAPHPPRSALRQPAQVGADGAIEAGTTPAAPAVFRPVGTAGRRPFRAPSAPSVPAHSGGRPSGLVGAAPRADQGHLDQAVIPPHPEDHPPVANSEAVDVGGSHQLAHIPLVGQLGDGGEGSASGPSGSAAARTWQPRGRARAARDQRTASSSARTCSRGTPSPPSRRSRAR